MKEKVVREAFSILVENQSNVLARVVSLYGRRGYNIDSLSVSATNDPKISRVTVVFQGSEGQQILTQTKKLEVVKNIFPLSREGSVFRELLLVKVQAGKEERPAIKDIVDIYRGRIIDLSKESLILEVTGTPEKIDGILNMLSCYSIIEVCRTGLTGMERSLCPVEL